MTFNLLQLPYLARKEIFNSMNLTDLFDFAQSSRKARRLLKAEYKTKGQRMFLSIGSDICFVADDHAQFAVSSKKKFCKEQVAQRRQIGRFNSVVSHRSLCEEGLPTMETYWSDVLVGAKQMLKQLYELFDIKIDLAQINFDYIKVDYRALIRWLNSFEPLLESHIFKGSEMDFGQYMWILEHLKWGRKVAMHVEPKEYFPKETLKMNIEHLVISHASWVTVKHLISTRCSRVVLCNSSLSDTDLNQFLKALVAGLNYNLRDFSIEFEREYDMDVVLDGLQTEKGDGDVDSWIVPMKFGFSCLIDIVPFKFGGIGLQVILDEKEYFVYC